MVLLLDNENYILYGEIIRKFENACIEFEDKSYYLNGIKITSYTFTNNYYFMLGDNRHNSEDSRYWGFVPESYILGKAVGILFSIDRQEKGLKKIRWERVMKRI